MTWAAVGTAAAIGAGIGGVSAAIQGEDILTGALMGGATGALTGGAGSALSGAGASAGSTLTTEAASQLAPELVNTAAINAVPLDTVVQQVTPELLNQATPELLSQVVPAGIEQITPEMINAVNQGSVDAIAAQGTGMQSAGINNIGYTSSAAAPPPPSGIGINAGVNPSAPGPFDTGVKPMIQGGNPAYPSTMGQLQPSVTAPIAPSGPVTPTPPSNGFMQGFTQFAKDNPFLTGAGIYTLASTTGMLNQNGQQQPEEEEENYTGPRLSANFQGGPYSQPNVYKPRYAEGGILQAYQSGGPVERMSMMNTAMNPQGGLYPQGMIDKTQYATPTQRPVSAELMMDAPAYERSNPMLMASGGQVKGYAAGGMPDFDLQNHMAPQAIPTGNFNSNRVKVLPDLGPGHKWNIESYQGTREEEQAAMAANQAAGIKTTGGLSSMPNQPTGQSMFPGAASMQGGFGQGAQGYPSFAGGSGGGGGGGPFPLEGQYGIIKMAAGGIASVPRYYRGDLATSSGRRGDVYGATQRFLDMYDPQSRYTPPKGADNPDVGIFRDTSAATRNKSAFDAAMTRQAALEEQSDIDTGANLPRASRSMGQLNLKPQGKKAQKREEYEYAASGGIMGANLGGYAAGGNPRLLKGPGDGMSDNIPAVIGRRQPARLADGEFVVPADVVSHLGNGSTDAGAKKLHSMMDNVRKARTGKKKQAPAVKANRFIPK
jgi:hypothetical protein